jgi:hypothetical protein
MNDPSQPPPRNKTVGVFANVKGQPHQLLLKERKFDDANEESLQWASGVMKWWNNQFPNMFDFHVVAK